MPKSKKNKEDDLRERLNQRGAHAQLIGLSSVKTVEPRQIHSEEKTTPEKAPRASIKRKEKLIEQREEKEKNKFSNKYKAVTFYLDKDLLKKFDKLTGNGKLRGEKTRAINEAVSEYLSSFDEN